MIELTKAEHISITSFLNAFFKEHTPNINYSNNMWMLEYSIQSCQLKIQVNLKYFSMSGRHQFEFPAVLTNNGHSTPLNAWAMIGLLVQDLTANNPKVLHTHRHFLQNFFSSCENLQFILENLSDSAIKKIYDVNVDFSLAEAGLINGHQYHPSPKSRLGFSKKQFKKYSPEFQKKFKLHYFLATPESILCRSNLEVSAEDIVRQHLLNGSLVDNKIPIPCHPWQAQYLKKMPLIKDLIKQGDLHEIGAMGHDFTPTSSVRTIYNQQSAFMLKFSLNVSITNSVRVQYIKELYRGLAADLFWKSIVGIKVCEQYPTFNPITEPAFMVLKNGNQIIQESAVLFRDNPFTHTFNNVTPVATLCQDHPLQVGNRFNQLIPLVAQLKNLPYEDAALLWFNDFLKVAIEPLLWLFVHQGIAVEAHQQNLLIEIKNGLPVKSYYRDNQGYYIVDSAYLSLINNVDADILNHFCKGTQEFISHHFIYYLICNSVFGIINALGTSRLICEATLINTLQEFIQIKHDEWPESNYLLLQLLERNTLPFKANLLTRFYNLDELTAPLEQQSIYVDIPNLLRCDPHNNKRLNYAK